MYLLRPSLRDAQWASVWIKLREVLKWQRHLLTFVPKLAELKTDSQVTCVNSTRPAEALDKGSVGGHLGSTALDLKGLH